MVLSLVANTGATGKRSTGRSVLRRYEVFDYDIDSDDEWEEQEEEEEGESLSGDEEDDTEEQVDEEEDPFVVPDGYLSDDERGTETLKEDGVVVDSATPPPATTTVGLASRSSCHPRSGTSSALQKPVIVAPMYLSMNSDLSESSPLLLRTFEGQVLEVKLPIAIEEPKKAKRPLQFLLSQNNHHKRPRSRTKIRKTLR